MQNKYKTNLLNKFKKQLKKFIYHIKIDKFFKIIYLNILD